MTGGYAPTDQFMGILSLYGLAPLGPGTDASLKIAPSIAVTLWPKKREETDEIGDEEPPEDDRPNPQTIQLGLTYDLLNRDDGLGVSLSIWRRF